MRKGNILITDHAIKRYAQRFKGVNKRDLIAYTARNKDVLIRDLKRFAKYSDLLYVGNINNHTYKGVSKKDYNYYLNNDCVLVFDKNKLVTIYKIKYKYFDKKTNTEYIKTITNIIKTNNRRMFKILLLLKSDIDEELQEVLSVEKDRLKKLNKLYLKHLIGNNSFKYA